MIGILKSWTPRGYGIVKVSLSETFFLHVSEIVEAPAGMIDPPVGCTVVFEVGESNGKKFPPAINAKIVGDASNGGIR
jgi:hypothetical protein